VVQQGFSYPSEQDRREIKSLCREIFNGRRATEIFKAYARWIPYITDIFLPLCDGETGNLLSMPFPGSLMEQPYMTMQILLTVQGEYRAHLSAKVEKMKAQQKSTSSRRRRK
jgi:hypothetical protein